MNERLAKLSQDILTNSNMLAQLAVAWAKVGQELAQIAAEGEEKELLDSLDGKNPEHAAYLVEVMKRFPSSKGGIDSAKWMKAMKAGTFPHPPLNK